MASEHNRINRRSTALASAVSGSMRVEWSNSASVAFGSMTSNGSRREGESHARYSSSQRGLIGLESAVCPYLGVLRASRTSSGMRPRTPWRNNHLPIPARESEDSGNASATSEKRVSR